MRRFLFGIVAGCAVLVRLAVPSAGAAAQPQDLRADADWLLAVQTPEGIITQGIDRTWCVPYFANIGARGLASAYAATWDTRYAEGAWRWLSWYQSHMNPSGFVTDYRLTNGSWTSTGTMDSTDAYAATFLSALGELYRATGNRTRLTNYRAGISKAAAAIDATTDSDGLTWAKPDYRMKYLMDNAEVYEGWLAATELAEALGDVTLRNRARSRASALAAKAPSYRHDALEGFDWAIGETGVHEPLRWAQFYPSASAQPWPVVAGLAAGDHARAVMTRLDREQPSWDRPESRSIIVDRDEPIGYWPTIARGFLKAGLIERARTAYDRLEAFAGDANRYWPFHPGTAGELIRLATEDPGFVAAPRPPDPTPSPTPPPPTASPSPSPAPCTANFAVCAAKRAAECAVPGRCR